MGAGLGATAAGVFFRRRRGKGGMPKKEDKWVPTTCNMCFNQCSILAHVVDGKVVELKGNPDSPVGRGHICAKGACGQLYDPNRITKPMKRTNPKGALTKILAGKRSAGMRPTNSSTKISGEAIERSGPHAVTGMSMVASQAGSLVRHGPWRYLRQRRGKLLGHLRRWRAPGDLHTGSGNAMPDYKYCNYIVQFGTNAGTATRHGFNMTVEPFRSAVRKVCAS